MLPVAVGGSHLLTNRLRSQDLNTHPREDEFLFHEAKCLSVFPLYEAYPPPPNYIIMYSNKIREACYRTGDDKLDVNHFERYFFFPQKSTVGVIVEECLLRIWAN